MDDNTLLLHQMMDIRQPEVSFWWPLAPGWWILLFILLLLISALFLYWQRRTWLRRAAFTELLLLENKFKAEGNINALAIGINMLLRRVALVQYEQKNVAGLCGREWLKFLDEQGSCHEFSQGVGQILQSVPYQKKTTLNNQQLKVHEVISYEQPLLALIKSWIRSNT